MSSHPQTIPAALDHIARELPDHDALVTEDRTLTSTNCGTRFAGAAAAMIALGVQPRRPSRDLVAEHLALGGRLPGNALRRRAPSSR